MKYKKNKLRSNEIASAIQDFYFLVKFDLVLIYILKLYCKNSYCSIHYLHFSFEKHVPSPVVKYFSVENLETTPSISLSKFRLKSIYLEFLIIGVVFLDYNVMKVQFGLCSVRIFFVSFFFVIFFYRYFSWQTRAIHRITGKREPVLIFLDFHFYPLTNIYLVHRDFYHFCLVDLFVFTRLIADGTCSP